MYLPRKWKKKKINEWDYIKLKSCCTAKETVTNMNRLCMECVNIFTNISDNRLISKIYKKPIMAILFKNFVVFRTDFRVI